MGLESEKSRQEGNREHRNMGAPCSPHAAFLEGSHTIPTEDCPKLRGLHTTPGRHTRRPRRSQLVRDLWINYHKGHAEFVIPSPTGCGRLNDQPAATVVRINTELDI